MSAESSTMTYTIHSAARSARRAALAMLVLLGVTALGVPSSHAAAPDDPLAATYEAHGGLARWKAQRSFSYRLDAFPLSPQVARPNHSTVDLHRRLNRIEGEGFTVGWDGTQAWAVPGPDAVGLPSRFFALGSFYFIGMPFVFADEGTVAEAKGYGTFRGKSYRIVEVGFARGTGHTSKDEYTLFIDTETDRLALINHSVTETGVERVTWTFDEWQEVSGLLVPARVTFYAGWNPDDPGEGATFTVEDAVLGTTPPDPAIYVPPADAVVGDGPSGP